MTVKFITRKRSDLDFKSLMRGYVTEDSSGVGAPVYGQRAIPVKSLNINLLSEEVTFQIFMEKDLPQFSFFKKVEALFSLRYWIFILLPLLTVLGYRTIDGHAWDSQKAFILLIGAVLGFSSFKLVSDLIDFYSGWDRVERFKFLNNSHHHSLTEGLLTVTQVGWALAVQMIFSFLCLSLIWIDQKNNSLLFLFLAALVLSFIWIKAKPPWKYRVGGEWLSFILLGPFLVFGYVLGIGSEISNEDIWLGLIFGLSTLLLTQTSQIKNLMSFYKAGFRTTLVTLGFEKAKKWLQFLYFLYFVGLVAYQWIYHGYDWGLVFLIVSVFALLSLFKVSRMLQSPLGTGVDKFIKMTRSGVLITYALFCLQMVWYFIKLS